MKHKNSLQLFEYWSAKRGNRPAPSRSDIEPADIRNVLPHVFICDLQPDRQLTFRLAGTALCSLCCRELKGEAFGSLWLFDGVRNATRTGASVTSRATPAVLSLDCLSSGGRVTQAEMLLLPMTGPTGELDRLIGLLSLLNPPYWVGHDPLAGLSTTGIRFMDPSRDTPFLTNRPEVELPPSPSSPLPPQSLPERRKAPHLVLLEGGRRD